MQGVAATRPETLRLPASIAAEAFAHDDIRVVGVDERARPIAPRGDQQDHVPRRHRSKVVDQRVELVGHLDQDQPARLSQPLRDTGDPVGQFPVREVLGRSDDRGAIPVLVQVNDQWQPAHRHLHRHQVRLT